MGREPPVKTIVSMMLGFALRGGRHRYRHGHAAHDLRPAALLQGFDFLVAVIGLFGSARSC
jgi:TctA family transporter